MRWEMILPCLITCCHLISPLQCRSTRLPVSQLSGFYETPRKYPEAEYAAVGVIEIIEILRGSALLWRQWLMEVDVGWKLINGECSWLVSPSIGRLAVLRG
jgi:hypothetical protein